METNEAMRPRTHPGVTIITSAPNPGPRHAELYDASQGARLRGFTLRSMKSRSWIRWGAIGALMALAILTATLCCTSSSLLMTQQHGCCKGRCASMSATGLLAAPLQVKQRLPIPMAAAIPPKPSLEPAVLLDQPSGDIQRRLFPPIDTVQLRI